MNVVCVPLSVPILCVIPYAASDAKQAMELLSWINTLGGCHNNPCLLVAANNVPPETLLTMVALAKRSFESVRQIQPSHALPDERWPRGANWLFCTASSWIEENLPRPWWWNEPDCIPLSEGWLEFLEVDYYRSAKPFLGTVGDEVYVGNQLGRMVNGGAIYPHDTASRFQDFDFQSAVPWDIWMSQRILGATHESPLIQHFFGQMHLAPTFRPLHVKGEPVNVFTIEQIRPQAVVFHRNKDGTLINLLRTRPKRMPRIVTGPAYYHSGNLGDTTYGLYAIKKVGGGALYLGPEQIGSAICGAPIVASQFNLYEPLLKLQPYLTAVTYSARHPRRSGIIDLNRFRNHWNDWKIRNGYKITTLWRMHCYTLGVHDLADEQEPWLQVPEPIDTGMFIVHRSPRYRNPQFPWPLVAHLFKGRMLFTGLKSEHEEFEKEIASVPYWPPKDFLEMARLIAGAKGFIGNQSFPCALALGLGQQVLQESWPASPDCVFRRGNFLTQPFTPEQAEAWAQ